MTIYMLLLCAEHIQKLDIKHYWGKYRDIWVRDNRWERSSPWARLICKYSWKDNSLDGQDSNNKSGRRMTYSIQMEGASWAGGMCMIYLNEASSGGRSLKINQHGEVQISTKEDKGTRDSIGKESWNESRGHSLWIHWYSLNNRALVILDVFSRHIPG